MMDQAQMWGFLKTTFGIDVDLKVDLIVVLVAVAGITLAVFAFQNHELKLKLHAQNNVIEERNNVIEERNNVIQAQNDEKNKYNMIMKSVLNFTANYKTAEDLEILLGCVRFLASRSHSLDFGDEEPWHEQYLRANSATKTQCYAGSGGYDAKSERSANSSVSSFAEGPNDFSLFRRIDIANGPSEMLVKLWQPDNADLEAVIKKQLFDDAHEEFNYFMQYAIQLREDCVRYIRYIKQIENCAIYCEARFQPLFVLFATTLLRKLPNAHFNMESVNAVRLTAKVFKQTAHDEDDKDIEPDFREVELSGKADVAVTVDGLLPLLRRLKVIGELKPPNETLQRDKAFRPKDQLLIEMLAVQQRNDLPAMLRDCWNQPLNIKGFLTDLMTINIAMYDQESACFYVAPRVTDSETYLLRWLFLLCDLNQNDFKRLVTEKVVTPPRRISQSKEQQRQSQPKQTKPLDPISTRSGLRLNTSGTNETKPQKSKSVPVIDWIDWDKKEEFDEIFRDLQKWNEQLNGRSYLCAEELANLGTAAIQS